MSLSLSIAMRAGLARAWKPQTLAGVGLALLLLQGLILAAERRSDWQAPIDPAAATLHGFERLPGGAYRAVAADDGLHELAVAIPLRSHRDYELRFDVLAPADERVDLQIDLFAPGYDDPRQHRRRPVGSESVGRRVWLQINSGEAPESAFVRLFYTGPPGLRVAALHFRPLSLARSVLKRTVPLLAGVCLALAVWLAILKATLVSAQQRAALEAQIPTGWALLAIYLAAALGHFAAHLLAPFWAGDEARYRAVAAALWQLGRRVPISADVFNVPIELPAMLYPYLIAPAFAAGDAFYPAIRFINAFAMCTVVFPTYALGRRYMPRSAALFVAALSAGIPFVNLAAYAATEVLFYPLFVATAWLALESLIRSRKAPWCVAFGCTAALLLNTRPSGIVVLPAFVLCHAWIALRSGTGLDFVRRPVWALAPLAFVPLFLALQWLTGVEQIGGPGIYTDQVAGRSDGLANVLASPGGVLDLGLGHVAALAIPYALPLAGLLWCGLLVPRQASAARELHAVSAIFFAALLALSLVFTVAVSATDLGGIGRWHARYHFPAHPLLLLSFAALLSAPADASAARRHAVWITIALVLGLHVWFMDFRAASDSRWFTSIVDNMDAQWFDALGELRWPMLAATALLAGLWYRDSRWLRPACVALALLWVAIANFGTAEAMAIGRPVTDPCGKLLSTFLQLRPGRFAVFGSTPEFRTAAVFWNPYLPERTLPSELAPLYLASPAAADLDFILTDADLALGPRFELQVDGGGCRIYAALRH